ncbi:dihydroneopterin aldolase [Candidatus Latescibacterota bacterium]
MNDSIRVVGLMFSAKHGVLPEEKVLNQPFEVDVEVKTDLSVPAVSDNLDDTVNYSLIVSRVKAVINGESYCLIEKLAGLIIEKVSELVKNGEVIVRVRKPKAPLKIPFETVEVELKRTIKG